MYGAQRCSSTSLRFRPTANHSLQLVRLNPADSSCCLSLAAKCRSPSCGVLNDYFGYTMRGETWSADEGCWSALTHPVTWPNSQTAFIKASQELVVPRQDLDVLQIRLVRCSSLVIRTDCVSTVQALSKHCCVGL